MDEGHPPTTDHLPGTRRVALVQYQPSVKGDNLWEVSDFRDKAKNFFSLNL